MKTNRVLVVLILLAALLALPGCVANAPQAFVEAERATYDVLAPEYLAYVEADRSLTAEQKARRQRTVAGWDDTIRTQEQRR